MDTKTDLDLLPTETIAQLEKRIGGLSKPSKMPGLAYGLPAEECKLGAILRKRKGSTCESCYAHKGAYAWKNVQAALRKRLAIFNADRSAWQRVMIELLDRKLSKRASADRVFRWHDSGDLQDLDHLERIAAIAHALPGIRFWLPTREAKMVRDYLALYRAFPSNLNVRVSAQMVGQVAPSIEGTTGSTVNRGGAFECRAYTQGGKCLDCRACWDSSVAVVNYPKH